uniref:rRNA 2'-O-methyltransferase fibrillarin-like n=1 Tax=Nicotiana tabacum TaxID=4097 RepID=A0A1S3ZJL8_TOBAC|nr:rRNA 2'-O-methyltransferase fibrillarin-like [Nicotiana tomentosiformis]XP_016464541.1 PREDICTED: rRNA 2'-O-methyltransferase fibrillarin-like [Nicotiana tabacum]
MTPEYKTYMSMLKYFDMACDIALGTSVKYTRSRSRPHLNRYRGRIEYYFTSSKPRGLFGASNGGRTGVRGGDRGGGRIGGSGSGNRGGRGGSRSGGRRGRGNGQGRGTNIEHDGSLGVNEQIDATQSQSSLFDLNSKPDLKL